MNHKQKIEIARRLLRKGERNLFLSQEWLKRSEAIAERVKRMQGVAHQRALKRRQYGTS